MDRQEAIKIVKSNLPEGRQMLSEALEFLIPELKESEDEKIRQDIITTLSIGVACEESALYPGAHTTLKEAISWLEKKSEQKSVEDIAKEVIKDKESAVQFLKSAGIMDSNGELAKEYRDEHNLVEWSEKDEENLYHVNALIKDSSLELYRQEYLSNWLTSFKQKKQWKPSKKQIKTLDTILQFDNFSQSIKVTLRELLEQLKKLREGQL